jgi:Fe-S-cluster containining protein
MPSNLPSPSNHPPSKVCSAVGRPIGGAVVANPEAAAARTPGPNLRRPVANEVLPQARSAGPAGTPLAPSVVADPQWPEHVRERLPKAFERAAAKVARAVADPAAAPLKAAALSARTARQRVVWLQRWGTAWAAPLAAQSACRRGCSHCCHVAVPVTSVEAALIGAATGRRAATPAQAIALGALATDGAAAERAAEVWGATERAAVGLPCPFLKPVGAGAECTIYAHRPFACRTHLSLDDDDLLCRLDEAHQVPVPRADTRLVVGYFLAAQPGAVLADIRQFFPAAGPTTAAAGADVPEHPIALDGQADADSVPASHRSDRP